MKAYKYGVFDKQKQMYWSVWYYTLEKATEAVVNLPRPYYPSDPYDYYEIHKIAVCEVCTIE